MRLQRAWLVGLAVLLLVTGCAPKKEYPETFAALSAAVAGESQASVRYSLDAQAATEEGFGQVARLFAAAARAEGIHAARFFKLANKIGTLAPVEVAKPTVGTTQENLAAAFAGETNEYTTLYPAALETAKKEGDKKAVDAFRETMQVEQVHSVLYADALKTLEQQTDTPYYLCKVCGNIEMGKRPWFCPICGAPFFQFQTY